MRAKVVKQITVGLIYSLPLIAASAAHAELYQDENGVWRQRGSLSNSPVSSAWKELKTSDEAYAKYLQAKTSEEKAEAWELYQQLQDEEREAEQKAREKEYEAARREREAEYQRRRAEIDRERQESNIEYELKWDRKLRALGNTQTTELRLRLRERGYSDEAINNVLERRE